MNIFEAILEPAMQPRAPNEGDVRDQDGFLVCGRCGGRKEFDLEILGKIRRVPCACACQQAAMEAEQKADRLQRQKERINNSLEWLRQMGCAFRPAATFSMNDGKSQKNTKTLTRYAEDFFKVDEKGFGIYKDGVGLMLYGPAGNGKTFFAECIANYLLDGGSFVWMTRIQDVAAAMNANYGANRPTILQYVRDADLLILDDFGTERGTAYMVEQAYTVIDERYKSKRPLIVTTNIDPADMVNEQDTEFRRLYERVMERCIKCPIEGGTRRAAYAKENTAKLKSLLGLE